MKTAFRITLLVTALTPLLAGCGGYVFRPPTPTNIESANFTDTRPAALRITVTGKTGAVLQVDRKVPLVLERPGKTRRTLFKPSDAKLLERDGKPKVIGLEFENGALEVYRLPPGHYDVAMIGPLVCNGLEFAIDPDAGAVALGSIEVDIFRVEPYAAMLSSHIATGVELASIAGDLQAAPETINSKAVAIEKSLLCHTNYLSQERWLRYEGGGGGGGIFLIGL